MRSFSDPMILCPYDKSHRMPQPRLQWHLANKCRAKKERMALGLPEYHCKFNFMHIFFSPEDLEQHHQECQASVQKVKAARQQEQDLINKQLEDDSYGLKNTLLHNYRKSQLADPRAPTRNKNDDSCSSDDFSDFEITEAEFGKENFLKYSQMNKKDQRKTRQGYLKLFNSQNACSQESTDETQKNNSFGHDPLDASVTNFEHPEVHSDDDDDCETQSRLKYGWRVVIDLLFLIGAILALYWAYDTLLLPFFPSKRFSISSMAEVTRAEYSDNL